MCAAVVDFVFVLTTRTPLAVVPFVARVSAIVVFAWAIARRRPVPSVLVPDLARRKPARVASRVGATQLVLFVVVPVRAAISMLAVGLLPWAARPLRLALLLLPSGGPPLGPAPLRRGLIAPLPLEGASLHLVASTLLMRAGKS